jgi:hypothetical protein
MALGNDEGMSLAIFEALTGNIFTLVEPVL